MNNRVNKKNTLFSSIISLNFSNDLIHISLLFILAVLFSYTSQKIILIIFQLVILTLFYKTKRDYIYIAFIFIIQSMPGGLFQGDFELVLIKESPIGNLYFWLVFIIIGTIKAVSVKNVSKKFFLKEIIIVLLFYFFILLVGFGIYKIPLIIRLSMSWLLLLIIIRLFTHLEDYIRFFNIIFYFTIIVVITQLFSVFTRNPLASLLGDNTLLLPISLSEGLIRPTEGITISFLSLLGALFFLTYKGKLFGRKYLYIIIILSTFSIFLSATRGWLIAAVFMLISFLFLSSRKKIATIFGFSISAIVLLIILSFTPVLETQMDLAFKRLEKTLLISQGDLTAGGTLSRISDRGPRVMKQFSESPLFGNGFGIVAAKYSDGHVGNQNLLMHSGIVGYLLFFLLWISYIIKLYSSNVKLSSTNFYKSTHIPLILFLFGLLIIHSTTVQIFNYIFTIIGGFLVFFMLAFANFIYWESLNEENKIKNQSKPESTH